ncbi:MAG: hypothetical protein Q8K59_07965 [Nitrosomonas sp.]|nr:hypothetical protein [Nitrosomonas sp.]MDP1951012.1 hypothetical protein [Nitrosomonas sp.]
MTKRGKQASRKAAARKYGFLEVPCSIIIASKHTRNRRLLHEINQRCGGDWCGCGGYDVRD